MVAVVGTKLGLMDGLAWLGSDQSTQCHLVLIRIDRLAALQSPTTQHSLTSTERCST